MTLPAVFPYKLRDNDVLMDGAPRDTVYKIRDLPKEEKPREKLTNHGPESLSVAELLAIVWGTGTRKEEVLTMASRVLKEYGDKGLSRQRDPKRMAEHLDIPVGKALQVIACAELGRRYFEAGGGGPPAIRTPEEVLSRVHDIRALPKEHLRGLYLNTHYKLIHEETLSIGTVNASLVHPREVFKPALDYGAAAVILVHNHPSGEEEPSEADIALTRQLVAAGKLLGIDLLDHIIVTKEGFARIPISENA